jgi:hypothetical protein
MEAFVLANDRQISMILFNSLGAEIARIYFDGETITFESNYFPKNMRAEYIAADFQLVFYKPEALESALRTSALRLKIEKNATGEGYLEKRQVFDNDRVIIEITKTPTEIQYINILRGYSYTLRGDFR